MRGFATIASADFVPYLRAFLHSLRKFHNEPVEVYTADDYVLEGFESVNVIKVPAPLQANSKFTTAKAVRLFIPEYTRFDTVLYSDSDVLVNCRADVLFDEAEKGKLPLCPSVNPNYPKNFPTFHDGIYAFDKHNENVMNLLRMWKYLFYKNPANASTQFCLMEAIHYWRSIEKEIEIAVLPENFCFKTWVSVGLEAHEHDIYKQDQATQELLPVWYHIGSAYSEILSFDHKAINEYVKLMRM